MPPIAKRFLPRMRAVYTTLSKDTCAKSDAHK